MFPPFSGGGVRGVPGSALLEKDKTIRQFTLDDSSLVVRLFGEGGEHIKRFEKKLGITLSTRGNLVLAQGGQDNVELAERLITGLYGLLKKGFPFNPHDIDYAARMLSTDRSASLDTVFTDAVYTSFRKKIIAPKGIAQKSYVDAIRKHDIIFGIGPAGTGKTYLAVAMAVAAITNREVDRIILTRPAVEAGEKLGFLPGDLAAKVDPYLRPLYDALHDMIDFDRVQKMLERGTIEVAPLAFMRGRTLNDSFIILDEAQNTTIEQMKMFLTRIGFGSKTVVTGDITQIDLPLAKPSGLVEAQKILEGIDGIEFSYFSDTDVVRHPIVLEVIRAFERMESRKKSTIIEET